MTKYAYHIKELLYFFFQLFVATCSPARDSGAGYIAWGHSTLIGPVSGDLKLKYIFPSTC